MKFISDKAGFIDVGLDPTNPDILWAASWERVRGPYFLKSGGPGSALWKTTDAGATWTEIKGGGWPETQKGRISFAIFPGNADIVYAMVEADSIRGQAAHRVSQRQKLANGLYRTTDGGANLGEDERREHAAVLLLAGSGRPEELRTASGSRRRRCSSRTTAARPRARRPRDVHVDHHAMWIDPERSRSLVVGNDGGICDHLGWRRRLRLRATIPAHRASSTT